MAEVMDKDVRAVTKPKPGVVLGVILYAALVAITLLIWLGLGHGRIILLTYGLPLLVGAWYRSLTLVWSLALTMMAMVTLKLWGFLPEPALTTGARAEYWLMHLVNVGVIAVAMDAGIRLNRRLDERNRQLAERESELGEQNEELSEQAVELEQQNEEIRAGHEELNAREAMLREVLGTLRESASEERILERVCEAALRLAGGRADGAAVVERMGDELAVQTAAGLEELERDRWPLANSFAQTVMEAGKTAFIADLEQRPDIVVPTPKGEGKFRSVLASPLQVHGTAIGAVELYAREPRHWTEEEFRLVEWVAAQSMVALETVRLRKELELQKQALDEHAIVAFTDAAGRITYVNDKFCTISGYTREELIGRTHRIVNSGHHPRSFFVEMWATIAGGRVWRGEICNRAKGGSIYWVDTTIVPVRERPDGRISGYVAIRQDVTARKTAEAERDHLLAQAEAANASKDQFLAVLSHELRTPLAPVLMTVMHLARDEALPDETREALEMVRRNVDLEVRLIDDLLDLSRITSGKMRLQPQPTRAHDVVRHALEICEPDLQAHGLAVEVVLGAEHDELTADPARLQQVLWNILKNAVKFTPRGGTVRVRTSNPTSGTVRIEITDTGPGIPAPMLGRIFNAFEQGTPGVTRQFGGLGLGLAISKAIVDMHAGRIWAQNAESPHEGGAIFGIELPLAAHPSPVDMPKPAERGGAAPGSVKGLRILLVEDHPDTARTLARLLRLSGMEVTVAGSVAAAREALAVGEFDLLLSDLGLPDGTGHEVMREARERYRLPGVCMSGYGMASDMAQSSEAGFLDHLVKPVSPDVLQSVIARVTSTPETN